MKKLTIFLLLMCFCATSQAQTSRRVIEKTANEAISQIALTGHTPKDELIDKLAADADVSIDMLSRMGDPDDARQAKACVRLIDDITAYSLTANGQRYVNLVRNGLKKAIDRSDSPEARLHYLDQLKKVAKPADAQHIAMYLSDPDMAAAAFDVLKDMPGIDAQLNDLLKRETADGKTATDGSKDGKAQAAGGKNGKTATAGSKEAKSEAEANLQKVIKAREGHAVEAPKAKALPKPSALPFWTVSLDKAVDLMRAERDAAADELMLNEPAAVAMARLLDMAAKKETGAARDALLARYVTMAEACGATDGERYLLLRAADELEPSDLLRQKIIVALGATHTVQALAYIRQYYDKKSLYDAVGAATHDIVANVPQVNGGRHVYNMLQASKQSLIHHYDEQGVGTAIDDVLDAIDRCGTAGGYNLASAPTKMGARGYWNMYDELKNFDLTFDWLAEGTLTVYIHSMPVLTLHHKLGARLAGDAQWHPFAGDGKSFPTGDEAAWCTANISVTDNKVTVSVNGRDIFLNTPLVSDRQGQQPNTSGTIRFLADENGATVRQMCIRRR